jgi:hypothetical protein
MKSSIFWNITPCSPLKDNRRFGGACHFHLQCRRISQETSVKEGGKQVSFLRGLFLDLEDGGDRLLRNFS